MRWAAAFLVFGFHLHIQHIYAPGVAADALRLLFSPGPVGVSFFFILSGFVLAWSARPGDETRAFWRRRATKLLPNHLATWSVVLIAFIALGTHFTLAEAGTNALLLQGWVPQESVYFGMNTPSWSLSCEAFFYLMFPILWFALRAAGVRAARFTAVAMIGLIWAVPLIALALPSDLRYWFVWVLPVARLPEFVLGVCAARLVALDAWPRIPVWAAGIAFAIAYFAAPSMARWGFVAITAVPLVLLIAATARRDLAGAPSVWRSAPLVTLGTWSFAFYLVHQIVIRFVGGSDDSALVGTVWALGLLGLALVSAALLYRLVETPSMRRLSKSRTSKRRPNDAARDAPQLEGPQQAVPATPTASA